MPPSSTAPPTKWGLSLAPTEWLTPDELALLAAIDWVRLEAGLPQTILVSDFVLIARDRAAGLALLPLLTHDGIIDVASRLREWGWEYTYLAEDLARAPSVESAFAALMASPTHRDVILNEVTPYIGIGQAGRDYVIIFVGLPDSVLIEIN